MVKKLKDPNAPKRPITAYFAWAAENRPRIIRTMKPGYSLGELGKASGQAWKTVSAEEKKKFQDQAEKERATYNKLLNAYKQTANYANFEKQKKEQKVKDVKKTKFRKDENAPKRPMSGYFLWMNDTREGVMANNPGMTHKGALAKLGEMWKDVSEEDRKPYQDKAAIAKKTYATALAAYKETDEFKQYEKEKKEFMASRKDKLSKAKKRARGEEDTPKPKKKAKKAKKSPKSKKKSARKSTKKPKAPKKAKAKSKKAKSKKAKRTARKAK